MRSLRGRVAPFRPTAVTTVGLIATTILTSATGFAFWWIASRYFPAGAVGLAGAAVAAMILLSQIAELGLGTRLAGVLHREQPIPLATAALIVTSIAGVLLGLAFAILGPLAFKELRPLAASPLPLLMFTAGVSLSAVGSVLDQLLAAVFRNVDRLVRNALFAFGRLALLPMAALAFPGDGQGIYAAWVGGVLVSLLALMVMRRGALSSRRGPLGWGELRGTAGESASHHIVNLSRSSSLWLLPLIVTVLVSREANAGFYIALLLANFVALVGSSATFTLYIVSARVPQRLSQQARFTLALSTVAVGLATGVLWAAGRPLLALFGEAYTASGYPAIVLLAVTCLPLLVKDHWIALQRIRGTMGFAAWVAGGGLVLEVVAAVAGALVGGVEGLAVARLGAVLLQVAFMAPQVIRAVAGPEPSIGGVQGQLPVHGPRMGR